MENTALYLKLYQDILDGINSGEYKENESLPSERYLCEKYHVSRSTIRLALKKLKYDGYIYTHHGDGSFVKAQTFEQTLGKFYSFTDELKNCGILINNSILEYEILKPGPALTQELGYAPDALFHRLVRLRSAKDNPLMLETTYLPKERFHKLNISLLENHMALYKYLIEHYAFHADRAVEKLSPVLASPYERELLHIQPSIPCTLLERFSYEEGSIIEYTRSVIRGDKYVFKVDLWT